jgi:hypothetical protein
MIVALSGVFAGYPGKEVLLDLDQDGTGDYRFTGDLISVYVQTLNQNQQAAVLETGRDLGSRLFAFNDGEEIGLTLMQDVVWVDYLTPRHPVPGRSGVGACAWPTGCSSYFRGGTNYIGVNLQLTDGSHYGWLRIVSDSGDAGGIILDWAHETQPNTPILAGAVPEPSTWTLLALGMGFLVWRRRRS